MTLLDWILIGVAVLCGVLGFAIGVAYRKKKAEGILGSAEKQATQHLNEAIKEAEARKKEIIMEAKDEVFQMRNETEKDLRERRSEIQRQERRIQQKEENIDRKTENIEAKEEKIANLQKQVEAKMEEAETIKRSQLDMLEKISGLSKEQAKDQLLKALDVELNHEKAARIVQYESELRDNCDEKAREILSQAIQRCAADHSSECTISTVALPNDEMKGRIIGREGRNIRSLETITGVDLIIDDTPEAITVSSFEPVRREIARVTLEKLISDGRIHPAKIEEMFNKATREVETVIKQEGEKAVLDAGVRGVHPELVKLLGKLHYRTSYGQNVLNHSMEVSYIAGLIAGEIGADVTLARRAGLLHDIGKALDHEMEGSHIQLGVEVTKKYKENDAVVHAIWAHHGDVEAKSVLDFIIQAADAVSAARPGARRENIENYIKRLEKLEEIANSFNGIDSSFAIQAGREIRIMVKPEVISDDQMTIIAHDIVKKIEDELEYPGQVKVNLIRESRAVDFAK